MQVNGNTMRRIRKSNILYLLLIFFFSQLEISFPCQVQDSDTGQDSVKVKSSGLMPLPVIGYSPETKMMFGGVLNYYFRESGSRSDSRPSTILPVFIYTQKKQIMTSLNFDLYWKNELYHLTGSIYYLKFPDLFYGIGNNMPDEAEEKYTPRNTGTELIFQKRISPGLYLGIQYKYEDRKIIKIEEEGMLSPNIIPGSRGGKTSQAGMLLNFDTRDNTYSPQSGKYFLFSALFSGDFTVSDYQNNNYNFDIRKYFSYKSSIFPNSSHVFAFQGYLNFITGAPSFNNLSLFGGETLMRGYYQGRYRDKNMAAFQLEYRSPIWKKMGFVSFAGFGDVSDKISNFRLGDLKHSIGFGFRYQLVAGEKMNIRFDYGIGRDTSGFYIGFGEAF